MKRTKLWTSISALTLIGSAGLTACGTLGGGEGEGGEGEGGLLSSSAASLHHGEGHGEGEGKGEGEGTTSLDLAKDDLAYLTQLGLMRGHVFVGYELYKAGHIEHAKTHMKHPESELYGDIAPAFSARGVRGFAAQLRSLSEAVEQDQGAESVEKAYQALTQAISETESAVNASATTVAQKLTLVASLLRIAGEEYAIAVVDGRMQNAHEYQDALGFTTVAKNVVQQIQGADAVQQQASDLLESLNPLWPSLVPPATLTTEAGQLYGVAAQIDLLALGV